VLTFDGEPTPMYSISYKAEEWATRAGQRGAVLRLSLSFCLFATLYLNQPDVALRY
jgi:hypothetical protein